MKVLVTGATGFVGSRIVSALLAAGIDVFAAGGPKIDISVLPQPAKGFSVDIGDSKSVEGLNRIGRVDAVVHTAGLAHRFGIVTESEFRRVNVHGVENVTELAVRLGAKHFVLFSSVLVYGRQPSPTPQLRVVTEDQPCAPADRYGRSKLDGERAAKTICEQNQVDLTIFRPSPIIGEGGKGNFSRLIRAIDRRRFVMVGRGTNRKSFIYVGDVAHATAEVLRQGGRKTQVFNLTDGNVQMKEIVTAIEADLGRAPVPMRIPYRPLRLSVNFASKLIFRESFKKIAANLVTWSADDVYSNTKLKTAYGIEPQTSIREAIRLETTFYKERKDRE